MYRVKWWVQDTTENGRWDMTGTMPWENANKFYHALSEKGKTCHIDVDEEYHICKNCLGFCHDVGECEKIGIETSEYDVCEHWRDKN